VLVFTNRCFVAAFNGGHFPFLWIPERSPVPASHSNSSRQLNPSDYLRNSLTHQPIACRLSLESESYVTTDDQWDSLSWNKAPIWGSRPDFYYCQTAAGLLMWSALSDERTGPSFTIASCPRQRSHSRVPVPRNSRPYFSVSDSTLPFSSPPKTRKSTVEVFDPRLHTGYSLSKSKSKLLYDWWVTANQFVLASSPLRLMGRIIFPPTEPLRY
jgi:hypothetical protein